MQLNQGTIKRLAADVGPEVLPVIIARFRDELDQRANALRVALAEGDLDAVCKQAHCVSSTARTCGLDAVAGCAAVVETAVRESRSGDAVSAARRLLDLSAKGIDCLASYSVGNQNAD